MSAANAWVGESRIAQWITRLSQTAVSHGRSSWRGGSFGHRARELLSDWRDAPLASGGTVGLLAILTNVLWLVVLKREVELFGVAWRLVGLLLCGIGIAAGADVKSAIRTSIVLRWFRRP